jgi:NurA-like 5'-3' nuclease
VEVPAAVDEGFARLFIDMLCGTAVRGYPYTLMAAHKAVNVSDSLMDMLCKAAGLTGLHTAREVLRV